MEKEKELTPRSEEEAYEYYSYMLHNCLYSKDVLRGIYNDGESHRDSWEKAGQRDKYGERDYMSYCNSQKALKRILSENEKLRAMEFTIRFDREIDRTSHYISPGGYSVNGKQFDFLDYEGYVDEQERNKLHCVARNFDTDLFEECRADSGKTYEQITIDDFSKGFDEFYIYTGEGEDAEIIPEEIEDITVYYGEEAFDLPEAVCKNATKAIGY